jgi:putative nucleotidyltransferase with HDIG domain
MPLSWQGAQHARLRRLFFEGFTALDLAEPLVSFDAEAESLAVRQFLLDRDYDLVGIRRDGLVCGYARREALIAGRCGDYLIPFSATDDLIPESASLVDVVRSLAVNRQCFVTVLDQPSAIITLADLEKPPMRMFLFGFVTITEMVMSDVLRWKYPCDSWQELLSAARLAKARELCEERRRRGQQVGLLDCLQFGDKGWILSYDQEWREAVGYQSRREMRAAIKELEMLRNNLAHTQAIIPDGWQRIVIACSRMEQSLEKVDALQTLGAAATESEPLWLRLEKLLRSRQPGWWERLVDALPELTSLTGTPQPAQFHGEGDVAAHTRLAVAACPTEADPDLLWVALLHDIAKPATTVCHADGRITAHDHAKVGAALADAILQRLQIPDVLRQRIVWAIRHHTFHHAWNLAPGTALTRRQQAFIADERFPLLLEFLRIDTLASQGSSRRQDVYAFYRGMWEEITGNAAK